MLGDSSDEELVEVQSMQSSDSGFWSLHLGIHNFRRPEFPSASRMSIGSIEIFFVFGASVHIPVPHQSFLLAQGVQASETLRRAFCDPKPQTSKPCKRLMLKGYCSHDVSCGIP